MIFFGGSKKIIKHYGLRFSKRLSRVDPDNFETIPHYYIGFRWGFYRWWIGYNRLKRIIRDEIYELDGKRIYYGKRRKATSPKG